MLRYLARKLFYGCLVLLGVVLLIFFLFQGFGDPARLVIGQTGDSATLNNIRKELALDQPKLVQLLQYLNDVSPIAGHSKSEIASKQLKGWFFGSGDQQFAIKFPYLRQSYQSKKPVADVLLEALPGTLLLAAAAMLFATILDTEHTIN